MLGHLATHWYPAQWIRHATGRLLLLLLLLLGLPCHGTASMEPWHLPTHIGLEGRWDTELSRNMKTGR